MSYCCDGVEGWVELKAGPNFEVRPAQVLWFEGRIKAGGYPLFLFKWGDTFTIAPGSRASALREDRSYESMLRNSSSVWHGEIPPYAFLEVLRSPQNEYRRANRNS